MIDGPLARKMHIPAIIFDLDGTLVDSLLDISGALNAALTDHGLPTADADAVKGWVGDGLRTLCARACGERVDRVDDVVRSAGFHYMERPIVHTRPYPNILKMLGLLRDTGVRMAVLSNKPHALTIEVINRLDLAGYFVAVRGAHSDADRKPAPKGAQQIGGQLGVSFGRIFMVGDSPIDVQTARNSGMRSVAVTWGFRPAAELAQFAPDLMVNDPLEILEILKK